MGQISTQRIATFGAIFGANQHSNEFRLQIEAIVEGFTQMQTDLDSEKRAMASIWKKREKQIQKVLLNTSNMYGSVRGIAGNAVQSVPLLELAGSDDED